MSKKIEGVESSSGFDVVLAKVREISTKTNPNLESIAYCVLKNGPRVYKVASVLNIRNATTGEPHHRVLKLQQYKRTRQEWQEEDERTISIDDDGEDQIGHLFAFLASQAQLRHQGEYLIIDKKSDSEGFKRIMEYLSSGERAELLSSVLSLSDSDPALLQTLVEVAKRFPAQSMSLAAALNIGRFCDSLEQLKEFVDTDALEGHFQSLLGDNPWMFGSEYSQLLDKRSFLTDEQLDFLLRRTADNYLEIVEIKRPWNDKALFVTDKSHDNLSPCAELTQAISQVMKYMDTLERFRDSLKARYGMDIYRVKAKIIVGRDGDDSQGEALRRLNSYLHGVEIITFDQLIRIAERVISSLGDYTETAGNLVWE